MASRCVPLGSAYSAPWLNSKPLREAIIPLRQLQGGGGAKQIVVNAPITIQADLRNVDAKTIVRHLSPEIKAAIRRGEI